MNGERWDRTDQILAAIYDRLGVANWQRSRNKKAKRPEPMPRPGVTPGKRYGTKSMPVDEWRRRYAARFPDRGGERGCRTGNRIHQPRSVR